MTDKKTRIEPIMHSDERRFLAAKNEPQLDEVMTTERHLLYVAATRARDYLWMSGVEPVSEFLNDLMPQK